MKTELPKEELNLIANINKRLKKLETLLDEALAKETPESLTQWLLSKRSIAPIEQVEEVEYLCEANPRCKEQCSVCKQEQAYLSQQGEQPKEWKEGEWVKNSEINVIGVITAFFEFDMCIGVNSQGGHTDMWHCSILTKPTLKEIEQHLTKIARDKYPLGTKVKTITGTFVIVSHEFKYNHDNNSLLALIRNDGKYYYKTIWSNEDKWAEIIETPVKAERWSVSVQPFKHNINDSRITIYSNDGCLNSHDAHKLADKIKSLLANL